MRTLEKISRKPKNVFVEGAINPEFIANSIAKHQSKTTIGAHNIFLGQVRSDTKDGKTVSAIEYSCYMGMAQDVLNQIREEAFRKFNLFCVHIHHSIGTVRAGELCLFVFTSSAHRNDAFESCRWLVEEIKKKVPIWGKEIFEDDTYQWKINQP